MLASLGCDASTAVGTDCDSLFYAAWPPCWLDSRETWASICRKAAALQAKKAASLKGLGDWFEPSCTAGVDNPDCVPHWYCYIPLMATPDCVQSFAAGVKEIASEAGTAVTTTAGAVIEGAAQGTAASATKSWGSTLVIAAAIIGGAYFLRSQTATRRRR